MSKEAVPSDLRREKIREMLLASEYVKVLDISDEFGVTTVTARGDLEQLAREGYARRVHGGAVALRSSDPERPVEATIDTEREAKKEIAAEAAQLVKPGQTVIIDVGSTALALAQALVRRTELSDVTVITNGLSIALELEKAHPRLSVIVTGGMLRPLQHSLVQPLALDIFERINADIAFIGCNGVHPTRGVTNINLPEVEVKRAMMAASASSIVLADSTKLDRVSLGTIAAVGAFDTLITDSGTTQDVIDRLTEAGLPCVICDTTITHDRKEKP